jgi:CRP-like cAMP-binding protein
MRSASMRRTPLARFASAGRKAGSMRLTMSQTLTKTRAKTDYRRDILSKPSEERTESDLLSLMEVLGRLRFAESLRHAEKVEVCKAMGFRSKRKGDTVFSQGDPGNTFYIVLSGSVSVSIRAGESESEEHVASLYNGDSFGELALLREGSVRSATVRAETDVEFLVISREDYNTILGAVTEEQLAEKIDFLIALPAFAGVPLSMIRSVAYVLTTREFDRNAVVFRQGEETEDIFFVERGGIKFVREVMDARALRRMGVHRDGPAAAARVAAREKGGFDATPPPPPGVDDVEAEMMDAFSHLTNTARRGPDSSGPASRPRTPTDPDDIFVSAASQARKAQEEKDSEEGPSAAKTAADGPLDAVAGDENATPAVAATENATVRPGNETETPQCSDTVGVNSPDGSFSTSAAPTPRFPSLGKTRSSFGGSTARRDPAAAAESRRFASSAAQRRGIGRLFLEAGRVGAMDYFGDVELTSKIRQPASAVTTEPTRCFVLNKWDMLKRVERDVVRRFRANKAKSIRFLGDDAAVLAEFKRAMVWDRYRNSLVEEVVEGKRNGGR